MKWIFKPLFAIVLLAAAASINAQTVAPALKVNAMDTVERQVSGFSNLKIEGPFNVHLVQGDIETVKVEAPAEIMYRIVAEVDGSTLKIHNKHDNWGWGEKSWYSDKSWWHKHKQKIEVYVTAKNLNGISVSGSGGVTFQDGITTTTLKLRVRGSGQIIGKVTAQKLESKISGSGKIELAGNAENSKVRVAGSGDFTGRKLVTVNSAVHISGSGHADINASDKVDATLHGSAGVSYTGTAKIINTRKTGSAEISKF